VSVAEVLAGQRCWWIDQGDVLAWLAALPADSVDLVLFSPPYEKARLYSEVQFSLSGEEWVSWMVQVFEGCRRVCKGLVACVCEGQTRGYRYSAAPLLLMADLHRAGFHLRKPPVYHRVGIPGSGGPDWLRNDYEFVICTTRGGRLPWADNTACGHPPKWAPGGEMSNRQVNGQRVNKRDCWEMAGGSGMRRANGKRRMHGKEGSPRKPDGSREEQGYDPPVIANPGNVIRCHAGGGHMGNDMASENEAPYPEDLAAFFIRSFCPPGGVCCDPFSGSGTTAAVAVRWGRRFVGCDMRESQVELTRRRVSGETPDMFESTTEAP
jgi:hypothetical protein